MGNLLKKLPGKLSSLCFYGDCCICCSDLDRVSKVREHIYLGSCRSASNFQHLEDEGITHILNTAHGMLTKYARNWELAPKKFDYLLLDLVDKSSQSISEWFEPSYNWIENAIKETTSERPTKVLVHCVQGKSRSVTIVIAYLMRKEGITVDECLKQIRMARDVVHTPNKGFMRQLRAYEQKLGLGEKLDSPLARQVVPYKHRTANIGSRSSKAGPYLHNNSSMMESKAFLNPKSAVGIRLSEVATPVTSHRTNSDCEENLAGSPKTPISMNSPNDSTVNSPMGSPDPGAAKGFQHQATSTRHPSSSDSANANALKTVNPMSLDSSEVVPSQRKRRVALRPSVKPSQGRRRNHSMESQNVIHESEEENSSFNAEDQISRTSLSTRAQSPSETKQVLSLHEIKNTAEFEKTRGAVRNDVREEKKFGRSSQGSDDASSAGNTKAARNSNESSAYAMVHTIEA
eukprot:CAMPEP_0184486030 /NCGR_PEP_ID=MMETSP0113_2-20130426/7581_1 /TAXON_ID=91329 /ORGANISM="Norrisiella sphaerica, Strain BC52" /LENGTH=459 /DNA_ID=CAMNT_0026867731 /DNA_START=108 /DNA_END=1487 /DNA_ORIENTATION=+